MKPHDRLGGIDTDLPATESDAAWIEARCACPLVGLPPAPLVPWSHLKAAVHAWQTSGVCDRFIFVRKPPGLRLRFASANQGAQLRDVVTAWLSTMERQRHLTACAPAIYEPEEHRFGGREGMSVAHGLWSVDARGVLEYECLDATRRGSVSRTSLWTVCVNDLLHRALDDAAEMWDVWCRLVAAIAPLQEGVDAPPSRHRAGTELLFEPPTKWLALLRPEVRGIVAHAQAANHRAAGELRRLIARGELRTGLRAWLAASALFQANRWGLGLEPIELGAAARAMERFLRPDTVPASQRRQNV